MSLTRLLGKAANARWSIVLACLCFVFALGCSDTGGGNNGNNGNNGGGNNGNMDAGNDTTDDTGGGDDTTDDTGGGDDTGNDTGGGECQPAENPPVDVVQCSILCGTGCESGTTCALAQTQDGESAFGCIATGTAGVGDSCGQDTSCQEGLVCAGGTCRDVCRPGSDADPQCAEGTCQELSLQDQTALGIGACIVTEDSCTLLGSDCGADESCAPTPQGNECFANDDSAAQGDTCTDASGCPSNYACVQFQGENEATCRAICDESGSVTCPDGTGCAGVGPSQDEINFYVCVSQ